MSEANRLETLGNSLREELTGHILPYWINHTPDYENGGFIGQIDGSDLPRADADRGAILNARILWTFAASYRQLRDTSYREMMERACAYLLERFVDPEEGGVYWMVDRFGKPSDSRKHVYAQAFAIYGLAECYRAVGAQVALDEALALYELIEERCRDGKHGGYHEAFSRSWTLLDDVRLSDKDADEAKSMNTHLHILEAYSNLYRIWPNPVLRERLEGLIRLFLSVILDHDRRHLIAFFSADWKQRSHFVTFGHDIEASWLLLEAADLVGEKVLRRQTREAAIALADAVLREGRDEMGGILYEVHGDGNIDADRHWWPQAEAVVGFVNAFQETGEGLYLDAAFRTWEFVQYCVVDKDRGEWFFRVDRQGRPVTSEDKVGPWKCPYHNARMCLEVMRRAKEWSTSTDQRA